jgi:hypothetical protein
LTACIASAILLGMTKSEAIEWAGGTQVLLAERLGLKQPSIASWGDVPPQLRQIQIEMLSGGTLKAEPSCYSQATPVPEVVVKLVVK